jgi:hypothetical protein
MKCLFFFSLLFFSVSALAQSDFDKSIDEKTGFVVYKGQITVEDIKKESSFSWFNKGVAEYSPDTNAQKILKKHLSEYSLVVFAGTWCDDSQALLPRFFKTLEVAGYPSSKVTMFGVDRAKTAKYVEHRLYKLEKVPTIILFKGFAEVGRIVEFPKKSVEKDLAKLIETDLGSE